MKQSVEVRGLDSLKRKLEGMAKDVRENAVKDALMAGALEVNNAWKNRIDPKFGNFKTSTYQRSVHTEFDAGRKAALIGTDITSPPYPLFLETGTRKMRARPAMKPAFDESVERAMKVIGDALRTILGRYAR